MSAFEDTGGDRRPETLREQARRGEALADKPAGVNPKDVVGATKPALELIPGPVKVELSRAHADGARKYGPYNWRMPGMPIKATVYVAAAERHIAAFMDGEEIDPVSGCLHLAHAMASLGILIDAKACGNMVDDRPVPAPTAQMIRDYTKKVEPAPKVYVTVSPTGVGPITIKPVASKKWEDHLDRLIRQELNAYPTGATIHTGLLATIIHDAWKKEANEITGVEPIKDALMNIRDRHPQYCPVLGHGMNDDDGYRRWVSLGPTGNVG